MSLKKELAQKILFTWDLFMEFLNLWTYFFRHGGWWAAKEFRHISGPIAIELGDNSYIRALDDGTFTVGAPHNDGNALL